MVAMEESRFSTGPVGQSAQSVQKRQRVLCPVLHQLIGVFFCFCCFLVEKVWQRTVGDVFTRGNLHAKRHRDKILQPLAIASIHSLGPNSVLPRRQHSQLERTLQNCGTVRMVWPAESLNLNSTQHLDVLFALWWPTQPCRLADWDTRMWLVTVRRLLQKKLRVQSTKQTRWVGNRNRLSGNSKEKMWQIFRLFSQMHVRNVAPSKREINKPPTGYEIIHQTHISFTFCCKNITWTKAADASLWVEIPPELSPLAGVGAPLKYKGIIQMPKIKLSLT